MPAAAKARARSRRTETPQVRRRQLLDAAKRRFRTVGFHATTMAEVAAEAGVSVGLIYQHFASKEALIEGIILEDIESQIRMSAKILDQKPATLSEAVSFGMMAHARIILDRPRTALMVEIAAETSRNPKIRDFIARTAETIDPTYWRQLMHLKPPAWSDETMLARLNVVSAMMRGMALQGALTGSPSPDRATLKTMHDAALWLLTPTPEDATVARPGRASSGV